MLGGMCVAHTWVAARMALFTRVRSTFERWLLDTGENIHGESDGGAAEPAALETDGNEASQRVLSFIDTLKDSPEDWLGKVRLINLDFVKDRVGHTWPKVQDKIELLAEKIIRGELSLNDMHVKIADGEFLLIFADASPEEARIRCMAVVETIQEKLFGFDDIASAGPQRFAECRVARAEDRSPENASANSTDVERSSAADILRRLFRHDAEVLDGASVAAWTQAVLDTIISRAAETRSPGELAPLWDRVKRLLKNLQVLESALHAAARENPVPIVLGRTRGIDLAAGDETSRTGSNRRSAVTLPLAEARKDAEELVAMLDPSPQLAHTAILENLAGLGRARTKRTIQVIASEGPSLPRPDTFDAATEEFEYVPVYRSASQGEHICQGVYRISRRMGRQTGTPGRNDGKVGDQHTAATAVERLLLERAVQHCTDHTSTPRFMLMVPVHVDTLHAPILQRQYAAILRATEPRAKRRLVIEISGYREHDNTISIRNAIEELHAHSYAVFITLNATRRNINRLSVAAAGCKKLGAHAFGIDVTEFDESEAELLELLTRMAAAGTEWSIPTFVSGIASLAVLTKAIAVGISYVCAPALIPPRPVPGDVERTTLDDLYASI